MLLQKANNLNIKLLKHWLSAVGLLHFTITVYHVNLTIKGQKFSLKVDFLFQSFQVITVGLLKFILL